MEEKITWEMFRMDLFTKDVRLVSYLKKRYRNHPYFRGGEQGAFFKFEGKPDTCGSSISCLEDGGVMVTVCGSGITLSVIESALEALKPASFDEDDTYLYLWKTKEVTYQLEIPWNDPEYLFDYGMAVNKAEGSYKCDPIGSVLRIKGTLSYEPYYRSPFVMEDTGADEVEKLFTPVIRNSGNGKLMEDFISLVRSARSNPYRSRHMGYLHPFICKVTGMDCYTVADFLNAETAYGLALLKSPSLNRVYYLKYKTGCSINEVRRLMEAEDDFQAVLYWSNTVESVFSPEE